MLHIAAGVFLGLVAYTITMSWWARRRERRLVRRGHQLLYPHLYPSPPTEPSLVKMFFLVTATIAGGVLLVVLALSFSMPG